MLGRIFYARGLCGNKRWFRNRHVCAANGPTVCATLFFSSRWRPLAAPMGGYWHVRGLPFLRTRTRPYVSGLALSRPLLHATLAHPGPRTPFARVRYATLRNLNFSPNKSNFLLLKIDISPLIRARAGLYDQSLIFDSRSIGA